MNKLKNCVQFIGHGLKFIGHEIKENTELAEHETGVHDVLSPQKVCKQLIYGSLRCHITQSKHFIMNNMSGKRKLHYLSVLRSYSRTLDICY
jgi:hypothetical protein